MVDTNLDPAMKSHLAKLYIDARRKYVPVADFCRERCLMTAEATLRNANDNAVVVGSSEFFKKWRQPTCNDFFSGYTTCMKNCTKRNA